MWAPDTEALDLSGLERLRPRGGLPELITSSNWLPSTWFVCLYPAGPTLS